MADIRIFRCWETPDILRQLPGYNAEMPSNKGCWGKHHFICEEEGECDLAIVLNRVGKVERAVECNPKNIWAVFQEPYVFKIHDWMIDHHQQYSKVFTHHLFNADSKYIKSYPMLAWYVDKTYDQLSAMPVPQLADKPKSLSWVTSKKGIFPGHRERLGFIEFIENSELNIEMFGSGINFIENKWDALADFKYTLAIENTKVNDYWTEKLADSFLAFSLPFYYGGDNIDSYFPEEAFIRIDIHKPEEALEIIQAAIKNNEWEKRLPSIIEARDLVLNEYNFFPHIAKRIDSGELEEASLKSKVMLPPYKRSKKRRLLNYWEKFLHLLRVKALYR